MNHFKGKQFQKDVIILAVDTILETILAIVNFKKFFMSVVSMSLTLLFTLGTRMWEDYL